jgi:hypothetical protein
VNLLKLTNTMKASCNPFLTPGGPRLESWGEILLMGRAIIPQVLLRVFLSTHLVTHYHMCFS